MEVLLCNVLRALPAQTHIEAKDVDALNELADRHGVGDLVLEATQLSGNRSRASHGTRRVARELDFAASERLFKTIDDAFSRAGIGAVALKGVIFAKRYYSDPIARSTSDIDLLVAEPDLDASVEALESIGFRSLGGLREARFRKEHHHIHLQHPDALPLELHFHAYRGFGTKLPSPCLIHRRRSFGDLNAIGVLDPADELVYMAVHAAGHRFARIGWLYDLLLIVRRMSVAQLTESSERAATWRLERILGYAAHVLFDTFGTAVPNLSALGDVAPLRASLADAVLVEPSSVGGRWLSRVIYGATLASDSHTAGRHVVDTIWYTARRILHVRGT